MTSRLSDDELLRQLRQFGEKSPGPITQLTRSTWEKRLQALQRTRRNAFSSDDSEIDTPPPRRRRTQPPANNANDIVFKRPAVPSPSRTRPRRSSRSSPFEMETSDSDLDTSESTRSHHRRLGVKNSESATTSERRRSVLKPPTSPPIKVNDNLWRPEVAYNSIHHRLSKKEPEVAVPNGYSSMSNGVFVPKGDSRSTNYSHCISWLLVVGAVLFFVTIGALYMQRTNSTPQHNSKLCDNIPPELCGPLLLVSKELHTLLKDRAGLYECGDTQNKSLSVEEAKLAVRQISSEVKNLSMDTFDEVFTESIALFQRDEKLEIKCLRSTLSSSDVSALEAVKGAKSLTCRIRLAIMWSVAQLTLLLILGVFGCLFYAGVILWKKRRESQERMFYDMVERVIDILKDDSDSCKPVVNVRDTLIPAKDRKRLMWLWERVMAFIEENESRVSVEFQTISGEDFKVWRWNNSSGSLENENGKQGKVWQGQAISNLGKSKSTSYSPSNCLKIRNMFDPEVERPNYGDEWQTAVRDAILEKCEGNTGIIHIAFDSTNNNEGCVFMMCNSTEAAGKAYNDLHAWWFDGKLVTVKYLKTSRYLGRFPGADRNLEPLRPSNDQRLSLSAPFFRSALERS